MAIQTPSHVQPRHTLDAVHVRHIPVTLVTVYARVEMHAMRKERKIRDAMNPGPRYRPTLYPVSGQVLDERTIRGDIDVTGSTNVYIRNSGRGGHARETMAVFAVNPLLAGMQSVAEGNRLGRRTIFGRGRKIIDISQVIENKQRHRRGEKEEGQKDHDAIIFHMRDTAERDPDVCTLSVLPLRVNITSLTLSRPMKETLSLRTDESVPCG